MDRGAQDPGTPGNYVFLLLVLHALVMIAMVLWMGGLVEDLDSGWSLLTSSPAIALWLALWLALPALFLLWMLLVKIQSQLQRRSTKHPVSGPDAVPPRDEALEF